MAADADAHLRGAWPQSGRQGQADAALHACRPGPPARWHPQGGGRPARTRRPDSLPPLPLRRSRTVVRMPAAVTNYGPRRPATRVRPRIFPSPPGSAATHAAPGIPTPTIPIVLTLQGPLQGTPPAPQGRRRIAPLCPASGGAPRRSARSQHTRPRICRAKSGGLDARACAAPRICRPEGGSPTPTTARLCRKPAPQPRCRTRRPVLFAHGSAAYTNFISSRCPSR